MQDSLFYLHIILCNVVLTKSPQNKKPVLPMIIFCVLSKILKSVIRSDSFANVKLFIINVLEKASELSRINQIVKTSTHLILNLIINLVVNKYKNSLTDIFYKKKQPTYVDCFLPFIYTFKTAYKKYFLHPTYHLAWSCPRPISISQLHTLLYFHL